MSFLSLEHCGPLSQMEYAVPAKENGKAGWNQRVSYPVRGKYFEAV